MQKSLFRQEAMDKTLSPDELDLLMRVTGTKGWLALIALLALVAAAVVWGIFGTIPVVVGADEGVLLSGDSRLQVVSQTSGLVTDVRVETGDSVKKGEVVARGTPRTQAIVSASLQNLKATRIVIAHRLSTIINADRIYVLKAGRIVQSGTYAELMGQEGPFKDLAMRQIA